MRRSSIDREEKRVTGRNGTNQRWKNEMEQLDTNDPNQRRLLAISPIIKSHASTTCSFDVTLQVQRILQTAERR